MISRRRIYTDEELAARPSKSQLKRDMHALQELGDQLAALPLNKLKRVELPESLFEALRAAQSMGRNEARRRQMQYVGKLMRTVDPEPIRLKLEAFSGASRAETARLHRIEALREALMADEQTLERIIETYPGADLQHLRVLRRNALKEHEAQKPPKFYREIFQFLNQLELAQEGAEEREEPEDTDAQPE